MKIKKNSNHLDKIYQRAVIGEKMLISNNFSIKEFGKLLDETWKRKKKLAGSVSNKMIDKIYNIAKKEEYMVVNYTELVVGALFVF